MAVSARVIDHGMRARIPGGSSFEDWMLPHEHEKGRANCRDALASAFKAMLKALAEEVEHEA